MSTRDKTQLVGSGPAIILTLVSLSLLSLALQFPPCCVAQDIPKFSCRITDFKPMSTTYGRVKGLVNNNSDKDFREVTLKLVVYDERGLVLGNVKFSLRNLTSGKTKEFSTTLKAKHKLIDHYNIYFVTGTTFKKSVKPEKFM